MDNDTNTTTDTVNLNTLIQEAMDAEKAVEAAKKRYENALLNLVTMAKTSTFQHQGRWFQVRKRGDVTYLCALRDHPRTWVTGAPKGPRKPKPSLAAEPSVAIVEESATTVIE